jgi:hypothetical protein
MIFTELSIPSVFILPNQCTDMELFDIQQLLLNYPKLSNTNELIQADILLMPGVRGLFTKDQFLFNKSISEEYQINFKFYSESQTSFSCLLEESAIPIDHIYDFGKIITTISGFYKLYQILIKRLKGNKFRMTNYVKIDENRYVSLKFEGTLDEYNVVREDFKAVFDTVVKDKMNK